MFELSQKLIVDIGKGDIRYFGEETDKLNEDIDEVFVNIIDASIVFLMLKT